MMIDMYGKLLISPEQPPQSLHNGSNAVNSGSDVEEEDGVTVRIFRRRVIVDDVPHLCLRTVRVGRNWTVYDPVVSVERWFRAAD
jgi:hypothetical protein